VLSRASARDAVSVTLDYEIFDFPGVNRADVQGLMIGSTDQILEAAERHGAKISVMFEFGFYELLRSHRSGLAEEIEDHLRRVRERGHDVQLHCHPGWFPEMGGRWDARRGRAYSPGPRSLQDLLAVRPTVFADMKRAVEELLRPVDCDARVVVFRAGKYQVQPHREIYNSLARAGFTAASNVHQGGFAAPSGSWPGFDYRSAWTAARPYQPSLEDINWPAESPAADSLLELPILTVGRRRLSFNTYDAPTLIAAIDRARTMGHPSVLIGHCKSLSRHNLAQLDRLLAHLARQKTEVIPISVLADRWLTDDHGGSARQAFAESPLSTPTNWTIGPGLHRCMSRSADLVREALHRAAMDRERPTVLLLQPGACFPVVVRESCPGSRIVCADSLSLNRELLKSLGFETISSESDDPPSRMQTYDVVVGCRWVRSECETSIVNGVLDHIGCSERVILDLDDEVMSRETRSSERFRWLRARGSILKAYSRVRRLMIRRSKQIGRRTVAESGLARLPSTLGWERLHQQESYCDELARWASGWTKLRVSGR
jgi:hypothetical protein